MINESKILDLINRQKETGLSITAFCANEGIPKSSYFYWRKKLSKEPGKRFIPILVNPTAVPITGPAKSCLGGKNEHHTSGDDFLLELVYPNGARLRVKGDPDLDYLRSLVCLLG
jgi:hypothetical protein